MEMRNHVVLKHLDSLLLVSLLDVLERLIEEHISTRVWVLQHDLAAQKIFSSHPSSVENTVTTISLNGCRIFLSMDNICTFPTRPCLSGQVLLRCSLSGQSWNCHMYFIRLDLEYLLYLLVPYAIVPEAGVPLLVLEAKQQDLLHESEPGLLAVPLLLLLFLNCILIHLSGGLFRISCLQAGCLPPQFWAGDAFAPAPLPSPLWWSHYLQLLRF